MSPEELKAFVRRFVEEVQSGHKIELIDEFVSHDLVNHSAGSTPPYVEGTKQLFTMIFTAFPDVRVTIQDQTVDGDKVWTRKTYHGSHLGPFMGLPPTGKPIAFEVIDILRIVNGKIVEHWSVSDTMTLMRQIGAFPPSGQSGR
jgi:predicted ester cyclase